MLTPKNRAALPGLHTFATFARTCSVSDTAQALFITAGAVSQQLKKLESVLGVALLTRNGKQLALTPAGQQLATQLETSFSQIEQAVTDVRENRSERALRLKLMPSLAICWLLPRLASLYETHPDIALDIATVPDRANANLSNADLAVQLGQGDWPDLDADLLFADALLPVCAPTLAEHIREPEDLLQMPLLHSAMRLDAWDIWFNAMGIDAPDDLKSIRFSNAALAFQAARAGVGVAIAQYPYVRHDLSTGTLDAPFPKPVTTEMGYYLVGRKNGKPHPHAEKFRRWMVSLDA